MWVYNNQPFEPTLEELSNYVGFVYMIKELSTNKKYIGKKFFWSVRRLPPLKGKTRKRVKRVVSDWQDYYGSNEDLKDFVEKNGSDNYERTILHLCKTKGECSYLELKEQMEREVLLREDYYNQFVGVKIHAKHISNLLPDAENCSR